MDTCDLAQEEQEAHINAIINELKAKNRKTKSNQKIIKNKVVCTRCEKPIPIGRLKILPEATFCVHCAEMMAKGHTIYDYDPDDEDD